MWLTDKKLIYILIAVLGITTMLDLWTAYSSPIFKLAETNPLFINFGVFVLTALNFIWMVVIIIGLKKSLKLLTLFSFVMAALFLSYGHLSGMFANIEATNKYYDNPQKVLTQIKTLTAPQKTAAYNSFVIDKIVIPYGICILGFSIIFYLYHKRKPIREKYVDEAIKLLNKVREV
jgi:hypothetical protein